MENNPNNVFAAFEILLEALETEIDSINQVGARAQQHRDYKGANAAISRALQATELLEKVESLCEDWEALIAIHRDNLEVVATSVERQNPVRLHQGQQTPEKDFCKPILKALRDLDGSARTKDALKKVELSMKGILTEADYEPLENDRGKPRWSNAARWARKSMVEEGLLKSDSQRGIWEITEAGRMAITKEVY